jgi:hypothetical protein
VMLGGNVEVSGQVNVLGNVITPNMFGAVHGTQTIDIVGNVIDAATVGAATVSTQDLFTSNISATSNVDVAGQVNVIGNVTANYFIGNGALLTGITATLPTVVTADIRGNLIGAYANVTNVIAIQGNVGNVVMLGGNVEVSGQVNVLGNVITPNMFGAVHGTQTIDIVGNVIDAATVGAATVSTQDLFTSNISATSNVDVAGQVNVIGNVTANYFIGNGALLTGITATLPTVVTADIRGNLIGAYANVANIIAVQGNVGNVVMLGGNLTMSGQINALGNVVAPFFIGNGSQLTGVTATLPSVVTADIRGNIIGAYANVANIIAVQGNVGNTRFVGGNVAVSGQINVLGNVVAPFFLGNGSQLTGITATLPSVISADIRGNIIGRYANISNLILTSSFVTLGESAGTTGQKSDGIAIGVGAGTTNQGNTAVSLGSFAGTNTQGDFSVAIGSAAGTELQGNGAVAIGYNSGRDLQGDDAVAIGSSAGILNQGRGGIAIGSGAGAEQGAISIAIGYNSGANQGANSICLGTFATSLGANSIVINGTGTSLTTSDSDVFIVKPIRGDTNILKPSLLYDAGTGEITYNTTGNIYANIIANEGNVGNTRFIGGNVEVSGQINVLGNVVAPFFLGNGSQLTGITATLPTIVTADIRGNIIGAYANVANIIAVQGNVGNTRFVGGNVAVSGQINTLGNVVAPFFVGNGSRLTGILSNALPVVITADIRGNIIGEYANVTTVIGTTGNIGNVRISTNNVTSRYYGIIDNFHITTLVNSTPVIYFDVDDSMYYDRGTNTYNFLTGGVVRTTIDSSGNLTASRNLVATRDIIGGNTMTLTCQSLAANILSIQATSSFTGNGIQISIPTNSSVADYAFINCTNSTGNILNVSGRTTTITTPVSSPGLSVESTAATGAYLSNVVLLRTTAAGSNTFNFINCVSDAGAISRFSINGQGDVAMTNTATITCSANANILTISGTTVNTNGASHLQISTLRGNNDLYSLLRIDNVGGRLLDINGNGTMSLSAASFTDDLMSISTRVGGFTGNGMAISIPRLSFSNYNFIACRNQNGPMFTVDGRGMLTAQTAVNSNVVQVVSTSATNTTDMIGIQATNTGTAGWNMIAARNGTGNVFRVNGIGGVFGVGAFNTTGADYAELFEWEDGNASAEDRRGTTVVLNNDGKINVAGNADNANDVFGVVSSNPSVVGDSAWNEWNGRYLRDKFGARLSNTLYYIANVSNETEISRCGVDDTPPSGYQKITSSEFIQNPEYDPNVAYVSRENRKEWATVGLIGKMRVLPGQVVNPNWKIVRTVQHADGDVLEYLVK